MLCHLQVDFVKTIKFFLPTNVKMCILKMQEGIRMIMIARLFAITHKNAVRLRTENF